MDPPILRAIGPTVAGESADRKLVMERNDSRGCLPRMSGYSSEMDADAVLQVRSLNRTVADRIGAVNDRFLHRHQPMTSQR